MPDLNSWGEIIALFVGGGATSTALTEGIRYFTGKGQANAAILKAKAEAEQIIAEAQKTKAEADKAKAEAHQIEALQDSAERAALKDQLLQWISTGKMLQEQLNDTLKRYHDVAMRNSDLEATNKRLVREIDDINLDTAKMKSKLDTLTEYASTFLQEVDKLKSQYKEIQDELAQAREQKVTE